MYIARILYPVKVLGPGNRIGIWFDGCPHACKGCSNPELWDYQEAYNTSIEVVMRLIGSIAHSDRVDGFTLTGGDPFYQPEALAVILPRIRHISRDMLCYTGYGYEELRDNYPELMEQIAVLIDGRYMEERNNGAVLRGSDNQRIIILDDDYKDRYEQYLASAKNEIQNFKTRDTMISVGIHNRDYNERLAEMTSGLGFIKGDA